MAGQNYFELLGIARRFDVDSDELDERYRELSKLVHPDRHVGADARTRASVLGQSMDLNKAYKTLRKPAPRGEHLLATYGFDIDAGGAVDASFLAEVLELREELDEATAAGDQDRLDELEEAMLDRKDDVLARLENHFSDVARTGDMEPLETARQCLIELRYVARYLEQFDQLVDEPDGEAAQL